MNKPDKTFFFDVCYIISHGFAARMVLQTNLLVKLSEKGFKVGIISPDRHDQNLLELKKKFNIEVLTYKEGNTWRNNEYLKFRKYLFEDIKSNPALWEKHLHDLKSVKGRNPWHYIRPYLFFLIYRLMRWFPFLRKGCLKLEKKRLNSLKARAFLKHLNPKLLVSTYPVNFTEGLLLHNSRNLGIKTAIHLLSWDNITCKGHFLSLADKYIAWGPIMKQEFMSHYSIHDNDIFECGVPHFDIHFLSKNDQNKKAYLVNLGLDADRPYLFFAMSSPRFAPKEIDIVERLANDIKNNIFGDALQLIVRPHPQNVVGNMADTSWVKRLDELTNERVKIDYPQLTNSKLQWGMKHADMLHLSKLLAGCSICINSGSTVSIDALMVEKPVVLTSFDADFKIPYWKSALRLIDFTHLKKFISYGGVKISRSYAEFRSAIHDYLLNPDTDLKLREKTRFQECGVNDGKATERIIEVISNFLIK